MLLERLGKLEEQKAPFFFFYFYPWFRRLNPQGTSEEETRQSRARPKILSRQNEIGPLQGFSQTCGDIIGPGLWKSILLLTWGAFTKAISYSTFYTQFLPKKIQALNFRTVWAIDFQPLFLLFYCLFPFFLFSSPHTSHNYFLLLHLKRKNSAAGEDVKGFFWGTLTFEYNLNSSRGLCTGKTYF